LGTATGSVADLDEGDEYEGESLLWLAEEAVAARRLEVGLGDAGAGLHSRREVGEVAI
jgi:hypothetical protein